MVLFFVFGGVVAAALPGIIGGLTIAGALGIMRLVAEFAPVHFFAQPVVTLMGLGIAVDYGLFMVSRFREEIAEGYDTEAAVRRTVMTSGRTIMFSAVILVASSVPLLLFPQGFLKSITYAIIASVMLAAILSITVLAAALAILGPNVDALGVRTLLRVPFFRNWKPMRVYLTWLAEKTQKTKTRAEVEKGFWGKLVNRVMKRPAAFAVPIVIVMIALIIPLGQLSLGGISEKYLPPTNSVRLAQEEFDKIFPGFRTEPLTIVMQSDNGQPISDQQIAEVRNKAMQISGFTDPDNDPTKMWQERPYLDGASKDPSIRVIQNGLVNRNDAAKKIADLRALTPPRGITVSIGGTPALEQDSIHSLFDKLPLMVVLLITTTTILMFLAFGSVVLPIKAAVMSALTLGSTMGVLTWMFVDGHGSGLMNYTPQPLMAPMIGLIIAVIWGLSTDYEVFLVSRMVEARERGMSTAEAIRIGTATTGRLITGAASGPGRRRRRVRVLRPGDDEVPGVRPSDRAAAGRHGGPDVPRAGGDEAAGRRLLVGAALDEAAPGTPWPRRDRAARRAQTSRRARARGSVGRCGRTGAAADAAARPDPSGRGRLVTAGCDDADHDPAAGQRAVRCGDDADPHRANAIRRAADHAAFDGQERSPQCREQCGRPGQPPARG